MVLSGDKSLLWGCSSCKPGWKADPEGPSEAEQRLARNCAGDPQSPVALDLKFAPELNTCPWKAIPQIAFDWLGLYRVWRDFGVLPFPSWGSTIGEQPFFVMEAFRICKDVEVGQQRQESFEASQHLHSALTRAPGGAFG